METYVSDTDVVGLEKNAFGSDINGRVGSDGLGSGGDGNGVIDERERGLARGLKQRHIQMIALAGAIGTGLFLGLGTSISEAGPLGSLLGFAIMGLVVCSMQFALGETSALFPVTGSFVRHAELVIDPALGFALGWNVVYGCYVSVPGEISAAQVLIEYWTDWHPAVFITILILLTILVNIVFVGIFGEVEFAFAILKIMLIVGIIIMGLVIDLGGVKGQKRIGFQYWNNPGPFVEYIATGSWGQFLGFWTVMTNAAYSFAGVESISVAAAETQRPRQNIPKACKKVFARVFLFYFLAVLIVGMIIPSNDPNLNNWSGTATESPFVIAAQRAGIRAVPSIVNAVVLTSAWSSSNQSVLAGSRILYGLALKKQAPKIFLKLTRYGIPWACILFQGAFMCLAYMSVSNGAINVFYWFQDLTAAGTLITWGIIAGTHLRLHAALKKQGISPTELPWFNWWTPYASWFTLCACTLFLLTGGFTVFTSGNWDVASFISAYLDIPLVLCAFFGWKLFKRTKIVDLTDVPIQEALDDMHENPEEKIPEPKGWRRLNVLWE